MLKLLHEALSAEAEEREISWKFVHVYLCAWHFSTDKVQLNIDFLVKFRLAVWSMNIDCKPLSFPRLRDPVL